MNTDISSWFATQPKWLQTAANWLSNQHPLDDKKIKLLTNLCLAESNITLKIPPPPYEKFISASSLIGKSNETIVINSIFEPKGINALNPASPLELSSSELNLVYGVNGSGKSGYVRLIKKITNSKWAREILNNVFDGQFIAPEAKIEYTVNQTKKTHTWNGRSESKDLDAVKIFDSDTANRYLTEQNETSFEPYILEFFKMLVDVTDEVKANIKSFEAKSHSSLPLMPTEYSGTITAKSFQTLNYKTDIVEFQKRLRFSDVDETRINDLTIVLDTKKADEAKAKFEKEKNQLEKLLLSVQKIIDALSDEKLSHIVQYRKQNADLSLSATKYAEKTFEYSKLNGVGQEPWKTMWEAAREYSEKVAYKDHEYPNTAYESACVLCQQTLDTPSKSRLISFDAFVKSALESESRQSNLYLKGLEKAIPSIPENLALTIESNGFEKSFADNILSNWQECIDFALKCSDLNSPIKVVDDSIINGELDHQGNKIARTGIVGKIKHISSQLNEIEKARDQERRQKLESEFNDLKTKQWLLPYKEQITKEHERLNNVYKLQVAQKKASSAAITSKKNKLAEILLTEKYFALFKSELEILGGGKINIKLTSKGTKGKSFYSLSLVDKKQPLRKIGHPPHKVLSEGECKLVTLAAFLADSQLNSAQTPFIFDDPITSLDADYEENVIRRLIELAKTRQVIVFTHRLSFLSMLESLSKKNNVSSHTVSLSTFGNSVGNPKPLPFSASGNSAALNKLMNEFLPKARMAYEKLDEELYNSLANDICCNFRIELERIIEKELFSGVVERFRRDIQTVNKLDKAHLIKESDCEILDRMMGRYSCFLHSQPRDITVHLPKPDELSDDLQALIDWLKQFKNRKKGQ